MGRAFGVQAQLRDAKMVLPIDIRAEHEAAMAALSPAQKRALARLAQARQTTNFNGRTPKENLTAIFEAEARGRAAPKAA